jgi:WW domain-containing adapter protein with coiled-coil
MSAASTINSYSSTTTNLGQTNLINSNNGLNSGDPPTPTQESELLSDHRKSKWENQQNQFGRWVFSFFFWFHFLVDNLSQPQTSSVSSLQSVMTSSQAGRSQGPNLTPSLANYCRADLIGHITGWPADMLEKQVHYLLFKKERKTISYFVSFLFIFRLKNVLKKPIY